MERERREAIAQVADEGMTASNNAGGGRLLEATQWRQPLFEMPMVALNAIVEILRCPMLDARKHIAQRWRITLGFVGGHACWSTAALRDGSSEEALCCSALRRFEQ